MSTNTFDELVERARRLPDDLQKEAADFVRFLDERQASPIRKKFRLDWAGALADLKVKYTSVELQHKALEWWSDDVPFGY